MDILRNHNNNINNNGSIKAKLNISIQNLIFIKFICLRYLYLFTCKARWYMHTRSCLLYRESLVRSRHRSGYLSALINVRILLPHKLYLFLFLGYVFFCDMFQLLFFLHILDFGEFPYHDNVDFVCIYFHSSLLGFVQVCHRYLIFGIANVFKFSTFTFTPSALFLIKGIRFNLAHLLL